MTLGPHNRNNPRIKNGELQDLPIKSAGAEGTQQIPKRTTRNGNKVI